MLALVVLIELTSGSSRALWLAAALFLVARVLHPFEMDGWKLGRRIAAGISMLALLVLGVWAVAIPLATPRPGHQPAVTLPVR